MSENFEFQTRCKEHNAEFPLYKHLRFLKVSVKSKKEHQAEKRLMLFVC